MNEPVDTLNTSSGKRALVPRIPCRGVVWAGRVASPRGSGAWMRSLRRLRVRLHSGMFSIRCRAACLASLALIPAPIAHSNNSHDGAWPHQEYSPDHAAAQRWLRTLEATPGAWQAVQTLTWFGRPLWLRQFAMSQGLGEAAEYLTQATPALARVLIGPDALLLSGMAGHLHLVVQLQRAAQGVTGFASVLDATPSMQRIQDASPHPQDSVLPWLHPDMQVHAAQWRLPDGSRVRQSMHVVPQASGPLRARLHTALARQGWRETPAATGMHDVQWQRRGDRVHLMADRSGQGSVLYQIWTE